MNSTKLVMPDMARKIATASLIVAGIFLIVFFGFRMVQSYQRLEKRGLTPGTTDIEGIRGWMTIQYVAAVFRVPADTIFSKAGIPSNANDKKSIRELGQQYYPDQPNLLMEKIKMVIQEYLESPPAVPAVPGEKLVVQLSPPRVIYGSGL